MTRRPLPDKIEVMAEVIIETIPLTATATERATKECELAEFISGAQEAGMTVVVEGVESHSGGDSFVIRVEDE